MCGTEIDQPYYELDVTFDDGSQTQVYIAGNTAEVTSLATVLYTALADGADTEVANATLNFWGETEQDSFAIPPALIVTPTAVVAPWPGFIGNYTATLTVALSLPPDGSEIVTFTASPTEPGPPPSLTAPASLTFDDTNWDTPQTATITINNGDGESNFGTITVSAPGATSVTVTVNK
jgi:hypothetical protein